MNKHHSIISLLKRLWHHISPLRRRQFAVLLILMVFASFAEMISIGAVLPFLAVLTSPERVFEHQAAQSIIHILGLTKPSQLLLPLTIAFGLTAIFAGGMRLLLLWTSIRISYATGSDLSISIYSRTLYQPYAIHCARNSSDVINGIASKTGNTIHAIVNILILISSALILIAILIALLAVDPFIALAAFSGFALIYTIIISLTKNRLKINSQINARESTQVIKSLQEGLGGIRDVLIDGSQDVYCQVYRNADSRLRNAQGLNQFIGQSPRYAMETLSMLLIMLLAYILSQQSEGIAKAIPILGALALGAQRLLPIMQQAYAAWSGILGSQASIHDALDLLNQPMPDWIDDSLTQTVLFNHSINLHQLDFRYSIQSPYVLKGVNLTIAKGSRIGFIGSTGSGKSTLLDIVMGLLQPTDGALKIDNEAITLANCRGWQAHIAHVPQAIFLADSTIEENIAFGVPKDQIDPVRVREAAQQAQIAESIESWPKQYQTFVGERGVRLSGGQRQRIGIARALYKKADVIIFDEATSALDNETEQAVMQAIENLSDELTILIIAHRLTTLKNCNQIFELGDGCILRHGSYHDIISTS